MVKHFGICNDCRISNDIASKRISQTIFRRNRVSPKNNNTYFDVFNEDCAICSFWFDCRNGIQSRNRVNGGHGSIYGNSSASSRSYVTSIHTNFEICSKEINIFNIFENTQSSNLGLFNGQFNATMPVTLKTAEEDLKIDARSVKICDSTWNYSKHGRHCIVPSNSCLFFGAAFPIELRPDINNGHNHNHFYWPQLELLQFQVQE